MKTKLFYLFILLALTACASSRQGSVHSGQSVNIGYGQQEEDQLTTSVSKVKPTTQMKTFSNIYEMIEGSCPGVQVNGNKIIIRGVGTNSGQTDPLFIVDGVQVEDISSINPQDVESIEVLKDGASGSIYGSQSGNGVILITLRK